MLGHSVSFLWYVQVGVPLVLKAKFSIMRHFAPANYKVS